MKKHLLKPLLLCIMMVLGATGARADETELAPVGVFTWTNAPAINYDASATSWAINQGGVSGGKIGKYAGPYAIVKFDASTILADKTLLSATLDFDITAGSYNSSLNIAQLSNATFDPTTVTTETFDATATQFQAGDWSTKNTTTHFSYDVKDRVNANNVLAFAIYTNTGREQTLKSVKLKLQYATGEVAKYNYSLKAVTEADADIKTLAEGEEYETNSVTAYFPFMFYNEGTLYTTQTTPYSITFNKDNTSAKVTYTEANSNIVKYMEGEDSSAGSSENANYSNGKAGYAAGNKTQALATLPAGKYTVTIYLAGNGNRSIVIRNTANTDVATNTIVSLPIDKNSASGVYTSEEFTVYEETAIGYSGYTSDTKTNQSADIDYIYVTKTGDLTEAEVALFNAKKDFQADITAAKAIDTTDKNGVDELNAAITAAETAIAAENATVESIAAAKAELAKAVAAFKVANYNAATAIANPSFEADGEKAAANATMELTGWTFAGVGSNFSNTELRPTESASTTSQFGHSAPSDGNYSLYYRQGWNGNGNVITLTSNAMTEMPAGAYVLSVDYKQHYSYDNTTNNNTFVALSLKNGEESLATTKSPAAAGVNGGTADATYFNDAEWSTLELPFTLAEAVTGAQVVITLNAAGQRRSDFFIDNVQLKQIPAIEVALAELNTAIATAEAKAKTYTVGEGLFMYAASEIEPLTQAIATAQTAYTAQESEEAVTAATSALNAVVDAFAPKMTVPAADKAYAIANATATGNLCITEGKVSVAKEATVFFTAVEGGYVLSNEAGDYIFKTDNDWTLSTTKEIASAYVVTIVPVEGGYTIKGAKGLFGLDSTDEGSTVYANKAQSNNGLWTIAEYVAPTTDYTNYIVNADLTSTDPAGFDANGTKGIDGSGIVKVGNAAAFDFKQTIANLPAGKYKVTAQAAYRYGADEAAEAAAIAAETDTKLVQLYATVGEKTVSTKVLNRYDGASETDYANGNGSVTVNEKFVPNSSDAVKAWFAAGQYVNEVEFNLPADGAVTIGINRISTPESDYTVIGPWTLTRLGDAEAEPEPEPEPQPGQDMTKYITNPSFETGNTNGWTYEASNDHGAKRNDNGTYTMTNCDGDYLFNIWSSGNAISQKIENLPNGTYLMKAVIATDANQQVQLNANGKSIKIDAVGKETGVEGELEFDVLNNTATIGAEGVNKYWYKVDNFRLTFVKGFDIAALKDLYKTALAEAQAIDGNMNAETKTALDAAIAVEVDTTSASALIDAANMLTEAATAAKASVAAYAKAAEVLPKMKQLVDATNVYTAEALDNYYSKWVAKLDAKTLTTDEGNALQDPFLLTGWHASITCDNFLLSAWDTNPDFLDAPYYINSWSTEGENDGSNFKVPFFEYWTGDGESLGAKTLTATMNNLEAGEYDVTAWVRVRIKNGAEAPAAGITFQANDGEAVNVAAGDQVGTSQMYLKEFTATGTVAEDGVLKIKFNVAADGNVSWLSFKNVKFEKQPAKVEPIEGISYSWESPAGEPIEWGGTIAYVNGDGNRLNYQNSGYYTICLNGKKANMNDEVASANAGKMVITLDNAVAAGDTIAITGYITKKNSAKASAYIVFDNGKNIESEVFGDEANIYNAEDSELSSVGAITTKNVIISDEAAGSKTITMTRGQTGTNLFITKLQIIEKKSEPVPTGISTVKNCDLNGTIFNMNGQKVNKAQKGLYIINGKKVVIK